MDKSKKKLDSLTGRECCPTTNQTLTTKGSPGWGMSSLPSGFGAFGSAEGADA